MSWCMIDTHTPGRSVPQNKSTKAKTMLEDTQDTQDTQANDGQASTEAAAQPAAKRGPAPLKRTSASDKPPRKKAERAAKPAKAPKAPKAEKTDDKLPDDVVAAVDTMHAYALKGDKRILAYFARQAIEERTLAKRIREQANADDAEPGEVLDNGDDSVVAATDEQPEQG